MQPYIIKASFLLVLLTFFENIRLVAQTELTKQEIINAWCSSNASGVNTGDSLNVSYDQGVNKRVREFVDSLKRNNIDSIFIYTKSYPGGLIIDKPCFSFTSRYPIYTYIIWMFRTDLNIKTIAGNCENSATQINSPEIFNYYTTNKEEINKEYVMPVIFGAQRSKTNRITYSMSAIDHEPNYSLEIRFGETYKEVNFAESFLEVKESLFFEYNLGLKSIHLWNLIKTQTDKLITN